MAANGSRYQPLCNLTLSSCSQLSQNDWPILFRREVDRPWRTTIRPSSRTRHFLFLLCPAFTSVVGLVVSQSLLFDGWRPARCQELEMRGDRWTDRRNNRKRLRFVSG